MTGGNSGDHIHHLATIAGTAAINAGENIPTAQASPVGRSPLVNTGNDNANIGIDAVGLGQNGTQRLRLDAQPAANHPAMFNDGVQHKTRHAGRNHKAHAFTAAATGKQQGADPNKIAIGIDQGTAGVTDINGRIGLDKIFVGVQLQIITPGGADDPHGNGLSQAKRIANGQHSNI